MKKIIHLLFILLPLLGAAGGYFAGPLLARMDDRVRLAANIWEEQQEAGGEQMIPRTFQARSFQEVGLSPRELYAQAAGVERRISLAALLLGGWCGLVIAFKLRALLRARERETYEVDMAACVACARCFHYCPLHRAGEKEEQKIQPGRPETARPNSS